MPKKGFADVEVNEEERKKFFAERLKSINNPNPESPEEKAEREHMLDKLAELASVVQDVKKKHRKKK